MTIHNSNRSNREPNQYSNAFENYEHFSCSRCHWPYAIPAGHEWSGMCDNCQREAERNKAQEWASEVAGPTDEDADAVHDHVESAEILDWLGSDTGLNRLNRTAGYDIASAICTKTPERLQWEQEYLAKRSTTRPLYEAQ